MPKTRHSTKRMSSSMERSGNGHIGAARKASRLEGGFEFSKANGTACYSAGAKRSCGYSTPAPRLGRSRLGQPYSGVHQCLGSFYKDVVMSVTERTYFKRKDALRDARTAFNLYCEILDAFRVEIKTSFENRECVITLSDETGENYIIRYKWMEVQ